MNDGFSSAAKDHYTRTWVALLITAIGAAATIIAAVIGVDAKHDREAAASTIAAKEAQINDLQQRLNGVSSGGVDSRDLLNQIASIRSELATKEAEIQRLRTASPPNPVNVVPSGAPPQATLDVKEEAGIRFELQGCHLSGSEITCSFVVTNTTNDRYVTLCSSCIRNGSRIVDVSGNEYIGQMATLGQDKGHGAAARLASGIPLKASLVFGRVSAASGLKLLEVGFKAPGDYKVQFHDIPLSGS